MSLASLRRGGANVALLCRSVSPAGDGCVAFLYGSISAADKMHSHRSVPSVGLVVAVSAGLDVRIELSRNLFTVPRSADLDP